MFVHTTIAPHNHAPQDAFAQLTWGTVAGNSGRSLMHRVSGIFTPPILKEEPAAEELTLTDSAAGADDAPADSGPAPNATTTADGVTPTTDPDAPAAEGEACLLYTSDAADE